MFSRQDLDTQKVVIVGESARRDLPVVRHPLLRLFHAEPSAASGANLPAALLAAVIENADEAILISDIRQPGESIVHLNAAFEKITGYSRAEAIGKNCRYLQGSDRRQPEIDCIRAAIAAGTSCQVRLRNYRKDGSLLWNDLHLMPLGQAGERPTHYVGFIHDVTELVETGLRLHEAERSDALTGCLNRDGLVSALAPLTAAKPLLVVKLDVARFHDINSGYGYDLGDTLLIEIAQRLQRLGADVVARVGSDHFALAFVVEDPADVPAKLASIVEVLNVRYDLPGAGVTVRFAIGYVVGAVGSEGLSLVRNAGAALAQSKASPLLEPHEFEIESQQRARTRVRLTNELQQAISADEFCYHFQPKFDLQTGEFVGAEALLRWQHGVFGLQLPDRFIRVAEDTGLILDIGAKGFRAIAEFAVSVNRWRHKPLHFAINVSAIEFTHRDIVTFVSNVLEETGADPAWLTLELTESLIAADSVEMRNIFGRLRELGVGLSIDDFGTEYSSLRYLEQFPITEIKIDRSFVTDLQHSATKRIIVASVIQLGAARGINIVAEGIENESERALLRSMHCPFGQGNYFSRPLSAGDFVVLARDGMLPTDLNVVPLPSVHTRK